MKQLSMVVTARVIWLCACIRCLPDRGLVLSVSLTFIVIFSGVMYLYTAHITDSFMAVVQLFYWVRSDVSL